MTENDTQAPGRESSALQKGETSMTMIRVEKITKSFGKLKALKDVSLSVEKGEVISVIGPSGSGKSTLLRCINRLERVQRGTIEIEGRAISKLGPNGQQVHVPEKEIREICHKTGMVFQHFNLFPHLTVLENLIEAPMTVNGMKRADAEKAALELLDQVGLSDKKDVYPSRISGGQKQRVAIARALGMNPDILLCDEPTSALDPELVGEVLDVLAKLAQKRMTMLIVTHEMNFAREISDRVVFMDEGKIIEEAPPDRIFNNPEHPRVRTFLDKMLKG
jgi:polar amino acid transport system ATP-binding protein